MLLGIINLALHINKDICPYCNSTNIINYRTMDFPSGGICEDCGEEWLEGSGREFREHLDRQARIEKARERKLILKSLD